MVGCHPGIGGWIIVRNPITWLFGRSAPTTAQALRDLEVPEDVSAEVLAEVPSERPNRYPCGTPFTWGREEQILAEEERLAAEKAQAAKVADDKLQRFLSLKKMTLSQLAESQNILAARK